MTYAEMKKKHSDELEAFPMFFAFNQQQFNEGMQKLGVGDKKDLCLVVAGGFIRKRDRQALHDLFDRHHKEMDEAMQDAEFLTDALAHELNNHEFCYTLNPTDALNALGITIDTPFRQACLENAMKRVRNDGALI